MGGSEPEVGGEYGTCSVTITCDSGSVTCGSNSGLCYKGIAYVQCDSDPKIWC